MAIYDRKKFIAQAAGHAFTRTMVQILPLTLRERKIAKTYERFVTETQPTLGEGGGREDYYF